MGEVIVVGVCEDADISEYKFRKDPLALDLEWGKSETAADWGVDVT